MEERELIDRCFHTENPEQRRELLSELFRRYYTRVYKWCLRFSGNREAAADLTQEVFLRALKYFASFKRDSAFGTWLYVIAKNCFAQQLHVAGNRPELPGAELPVDIPDERSVQPHAKIERDSSVRVLLALLERTLEDTEIRVLLLHYANDCSLDDITKQLKLTNLSGAKAYIVSAKRKLAWVISKKQPSTRRAGGA